MISASLVKELREKTGAGMLDCKKALEETNGNIEEAITWLRERGISQAAKKAGRIAAEGIAAITIKGNKAVVVEVNSETDFVAKNEEFTSFVDVILETVVNSDATDLESALKLETSEGTLQDLLVDKTSKIGERLDIRRISVVEKEDNDVFGPYIHMGGKIAVLTVVESVSEEVAKDVSMHAAAMRPSYIRRDEVSSDELDKERGILTEQAKASGKPEEIIKKMVEGGIQKYYKEICLEEQPFVKDPSMDVATYVKNAGGKIKVMIRYEVGEGIEKKEEDFAAEVMSQIKKQ